MPSIFLVLLISMKPCTALNLHHSFGKICGTRDIVLRVLVYWSCVTFISTFVHCLSSGAYVKDASATTNNLGKNSGIFSQKQTSVSHTQQCSKGQLFSDNSHSRHSGEQEISTEMNKSKMGNTKQPISTVTIESHSCPICPYETDCADVLLVHINQVHFEDTPEKTTATRKVSIGDTAKSRVNKSYDTVAENVSKKSTKV